MPGGMGGGMGGAMGGGMGGGMGAPGGGAAPAAGGGTFSGAPLEPSRANPFASIDSEPAGAGQYRTHKTKYGPDWSRVPLGYMTSLPQPQIPAAPPVSLPPNPTSAANLLRVSAVVWPAQDTGKGAPGRAFATYEGPDGRTRIAVPGSQISVTDPATKRGQRWRVTGVKPDGLVLRNADTGEETSLRVQARSRAEARYYGAQRLSADMTNAQEHQRVEPGAGVTALGTAGGGAQGGAMGGMGAGGMGGMGGAGPMGGPGGGMAAPGR